MPSIPANVYSVAISGDGKRVAWTPIKTPQRSELTVEEYVGGESKILHKISVDGYISAFSFSPNGDLLSYFQGPPEATHSDGFSLMLLDMKNLEKQPLEIAPPSMPTRPINPGRSDPSWSPTGELILFEARYKSEETLRGSYYIVSIDGRILGPSSGGIWDQDGRYIRDRMKIGDLSSNDYIVIEMDVSSYKEKRYTDDIIKLGSSSPVSWSSLSPSGQKIAYIMNKEIFVYDTIKKTTVSYGTSQDSRKFFWIFPEE